MIMAGGAGTRLSVLSEKRAKPSVPFAGKFRIIDFTLSNCVNSGIYNVAVLTQYRPHSLNAHISIGKPWDLDRTRGGVRLLHPYRGRADQDWYKGTADAVYQNLGYIHQHRADTVLVLSGDHIYKMDYQPMLRFHEEKQADLTLAVMNVPPEETHRFGIMRVDDDGRVVEFLEKPKEAPSTLANMGVYVFNADVLAERLREGSKEHPDLDFGKHVIPGMIERDRVYAFPFDGYWVDVGTIQAYWEANMELLSPHSQLDLYDLEWVIRTRSQERPPGKLGLQARVKEAIICNGCVVRGTVEHSVLSPGVYVSPGAVVRDSIVMNDTWIGPGAVIDRAILDKEVVVGAGARVGHGDEMDVPNKQEPERINTGITVVGKQAHIPARIAIGRNVVINADVDEDAFKPYGGTVPSGETV